jgi:hypothetical protein
MHKCFLIFIFIFLQGILGEATLNSFIDEIFEFAFFRKNHFSHDCNRVTDQNVLVLPAYCIPVDLNHRSCKGIASRDGFTLHWPLSAYTWTCWLSAA